MNLCIVSGVSAVFRTFPDKNKRKTGNMVNPKWFPQRDFQKEDNLKCGTSHFFIAFYVLNLICARKVTFNTYNSVIFSGRKTRWVMTLSVSPSLFAPGFFLLRNSVATQMSKTQKKFGGTADKNNVKNKTEFIETLFRIYKEQGQTQFIDLWLHTLGTNKRLFLKLRT